MDIDDKKWQIPERYRISDAFTDDEYEKTLLRIADEAQEIWKAAANVPRVPPTPKTRERFNALIFIDTLENVRKESKKKKSGIVFTDTQVEQLAECYASIGRYDLAAETTQNNELRAVYEKYWQAVFLDDEKWCEHVNSHKFIKDNVFSLKEGKEMPLLACNVCGAWNVADAPENLLEAQAKRAEVRKKVSGKPQAEVMQFLNASNLRR